jgi:LysM repeat protein
VSPEHLKPAPKQIESYTYEDIVRGTARPRPEVKNAAATESRPSGATVEYVVKSGDTLDRIARRELGGREQVGKIIALNKGINPSKMKIGQKILLPVVQRETRLVAEAPKAKPKAAASPTAAGTSRRQFEPVTAKSTKSL